ncbi:helix-turn-helix domain-containing protein [Candidatus Bathyarchaeota archaeon]|nr:helix-turn-helix domain-containing protein [Candidatus Bathyarchaeota archaeon]
MKQAETEIVEAAESILKKDGFILSQRCCSRPSCFDFAARKDKNLLLIKVQKDIGNVSANDSRELKLISECISAASLLISEKTREKPLEDDTVYSRYNVSAVTLKTFESMALHEKYPLIQAGPGGYYVEIDEEVIKRKRQELGLSIGEMAGMIGISRRTLYGYERGMAKASVSAAYNMIWVLGIPVAKSINVFETARNKQESLLVSAKRVITKNRLLRKILRKLVHGNVPAIHVRKAPFDFVVKVPEGKMKIIGGVADGKEPELDRRVDEILSVSRVVQARSVFITDGPKPSNKDIPFIHVEELSKIRGPEDFVAKL